MTPTIHEKQTSIPHWLALQDGLMLDLQPAVQNYQPGEFIIYKPYGDRYDERLIERRIKKVVSGYEVGHKDFQLLILDYSTKEMTEIEYKKILAIVLSLLLLSLMYFVWLYS